ncbi:hypothetical protein KDD93_06820 [Campylobacter sp. faydin G-24]|uniref:DUF2634 domain-containing protein n=1 Tax=Campylobacter anatolicus TaxID=2829105 RepID=A0ABS5HKY6_9BACT|nr:hypothetical protein [Campylobacter anatolicus]MBR8464272.1 hypothetical protein [Campylobacter anatolicus]
MVRAIDENGDWTMGRLNESPAIAQNIKTAILSLYNDWFYELDYGVRWFDFLVKNPNFAALERDIKTQILNVSGVVSLDEFSLNLDERTAKIELRYTDIYNKKQDLSVEYENN